MTSNSKAAAQTSTVQEATQPLQSERQPSGRATGTTVPIVADTDAHKKLPGMNAGHGNKVKRPHFGSPARRGSSSAPML